jgi:hypothetical protein
VDHSQGRPGGGKHSHSFLSFIREERGEEHVGGSLERTVAYVTNLSSSHVGVLYVENNLASTTRMF